MTSADQSIREAFGVGVEMAWRRSPGVRAYIMAVWAHNTVSMPSGAAQSDFGASWRPCPAPRACSAAGACMLVQARSVRVSRERGALRVTRGV